MVCWMWEVIFKSYSFDKIWILSVRLAQNLYNILHIVANNARDSKQAFH